MKTFFATFLLISLFTPAFSQSQPVCDIRFKIDKFQGEYVLLAYHFGDKQYILDTLRRQADGTFSYQSDSLLQGGIYLFVMPPRNIYFEFLIDSKDGQQFGLETDTSDFAKNMKVVGSKQNEVFYEDIRFVSEKRKQADSLDAAIKAAKKDSAKIKEIQAQKKELDKEVLDKRMKIVEEYPDFLYSAMLKATKEPKIPIEARKDTLATYKYYKAHYWDLIDFSDDRLLRTPILQGKLVQYLDKVCNPNADSLIKENLWLIEKAEKGNNFDMFKYMVVSLLNKYANSKKMGDDAVYVAIAENYYCTGIALQWTDSAQVEKICNRIKNISYPCGGRTIQFLNPPLLDLKRNIQYLSRDRVDYSLVFLWQNHEDTETMKRLDQLQAIAKYYGEKHLKLYVISVGLSFSDWQKSIEKYTHRSKELYFPEKLGYSFPLNGILAEMPATYIYEGIHLLDTTQQLIKKIDLLGVSSRFFILDKDKKIIAKYVSPKQCDEIINHYLYNKDEANLIWPKEENE